MGVGPPPIVAAATRDELAAIISARYPFILLGYATLGPIIWMTLNFSWWRKEFQDLEMSDRPNSEKTPIGSPGDPEPDKDGPKFIDRLPFAKRGDLWALSSELHYVRVYTSLGDDLVLMRLSDAIEQTDGVDGLQVHRSHWIAQGGVQRIQNSGGKMLVVLKNDIELPVSRSHQGAVRNILGHLIE
ncbi:MAG: LytTR family DNA-binding domain-containing protein [Pseudomonadota bacterium]